MSKEKKPKGRPPKNLNLNLAELKPEQNINIENLFPITKIMTKRTALIDEKSLYKYKFKDVGTIITLTECLKQQKSPYTIIFTNNGIIITYSESDKSEATVECKIFPDNAIEYTSKTGLDVIINIEMDKLCNALKTIPKKNICSINLLEDNGGKTLEISDSSSEGGPVTLKRIPITIPITYTNINYLEKSNYECIIMMEAKVFCETCKSIASSEHKDFEMQYKNKKFDFSWGNTDCRKTFTPDKKFIIIKDTDRKICNKYTITCFKKFLVPITKISTTVKIYLSLEAPTIMEYNSDGIAVTQIMCKIKNEIKSK